MELYWFNISLFVSDLTYRACLWHSKEVGVAHLPDHMILVVCGPSRPRRSDHRGHVDGLLRLPQCGHGSNCVPNLRMATTTPAAAETAKASRIGYLSPA